MTRIRMLVSCVWFLISDPTFICQWFFSYTCFSFFSFFHRRHYRNPTESLNGTLAFFTQFTISTWWISFDSTHLTRTEWFRCLGFSSSSFSSCFFFRSYVSHCVNDRWDSRWCFLFSVIKYTINYVGSK